jgi:hypothetical protein
LMQTAYIALWAVLLSSVEVVSFMLKFITYHNGWSYWLSVLFCKVTRRTFKLFKWI